MREMPLLVVIDWLENWARWCRGGHGAPLGVELSDPCSWYESPERNHHEPPAARVIVRPVYATPAETVERTIRAEAFPDASRAAVVATYLTWPTELLRRLHVKPERWDGRRAKAAHMRPPEYREALTDAHTRLARTLWPWQHLLPRVA